MNSTRVRFAIRASILAAGLLLGPFTHAALANSVTIGATSYGTIQEAINAVLTSAKPDGSLINVGPGTYNESLSVGNLKSTSFTVRGTSGAASTFVDATGKNASALLVDRMSGTIVFQGLTFRNGTGSGSPAAGGGINIQTSSPSFVDSIFESNSAFSGGGGYLSVSNATFTGCIFRANSAAHFGGGVYMEGGSQPVFTNTVIFGNVSGTSTVDGAGGGVAVTDASPTFISSIINFNTSRFAGGGIFHQGYYPSQVASTHGRAQLVLTDTEVSDNTSLKFSPGDNAAEGGGIHIEDNATATLTRVRILRNSAGTGGGLNASCAQYDVTDSVIDTNHATVGGGFGAGIAVICNIASATITPSVVNLTRTLVRNNDSSVGAGISAIGTSGFRATLTLTGSVVDSNHSTSQGGGILASQSNLTVTNSLIMRNTVANGASPYGGGMEILNSAVTMTGSTIAQNSASTTAADIHGGGIDISDSTFDIGTSNIYANSATAGGADSSRGGGVFISSALTGSIHNSIVTDNTTSHYEGQIWEEVCPSGQQLTYPNNIVVPKTGTTQLNGACTAGPNNMFTRATGLSSPTASARFSAFVAVPANTGIPGSVMTLAWSIWRATAVTVGGVGTFTAPDRAPTGSADVTPSFTSSYTLTATATGGNGGNYNSVAPVTVTVIGSSPPVQPTITLNPTNKVIRPGVTTSFACAASGTPTPTFQWQVSNDKGVSFTNITNTGPYTGTTTTTLQVSNVLGLSGRQYRCVANNAAGSASSNPAALRVHLAGGDFDGDGKSDISVFRESGGLGTWYSLLSSTGGAASPVSWGLTGDVPVQADYDGDGKNDYAVFRPSTSIWYIKNSSDGATQFLQWGATGDIPVPGDYDGDGKADAAVFRPSTGIWYVRDLVTNTPSFYQWGLNGDIPVAGDYDGDGLTDVAVFRPSTGIWYVRNSSDNSTAFLQWGITGDVPVPGDYNGDGKADAAVFRPSTNIWYVRDLATNQPLFYQWGATGDMQVPGDFDGDGATDVAVFRPLTAIWYVWYVGGGPFAFFQWGLNSDVPILKR